MTDDDLTDDDMKDNDWRRLFVAFVKKSFRSCYLSSFLFVLSLLSSLFSLSLPTIVFFFVVVNLCFRQSISFRLRFCFCFGNLRRDGAAEIEMMLSDG